MLPNVRLQFKATVVYATIVAAVMCRCSLVTAQFSNCVTSNVTEQTICSWPDSPLILFDDVTGLDPIVFNDNVVLLSVCDAGEPFAILNCRCEISVQDSTTDFDINDLCNSCTLRSITEFGFAIYWDCSNRDVGSCPVFNSNGCQNTTASATEVPTTPPIDFAIFPSPIPTLSPAISPSTTSPTDTPTSPPIQSTMPPSQLPTMLPTMFPSTVPSVIIVTETPTMTKSIGGRGDTSTVIPTNINEQASNTNKSVVGTAVIAVVGGFALACIMGLMVFFIKRNQSGSTSSSTPNKATLDDDNFTSSLPPTIGSSVTASYIRPSESRQPAIFSPIVETRTCQNTYRVDAPVLVPNGNTKREVFVPPPDMRISNVVQPMQIISSSSASSSPQRQSYPTNHIVDVKDQCRSVAMVRASSPTVVTQQDSSSRIPFAVVVGVSTTASLTSSLSTPSSRSRREPNGRMMMDA